jgi:hypothetical protein
MKIEILDQAEDDLIEGFHFYEAQRPGLGSHFVFWSVSTKISILFALTAESIASHTKIITVSWPGGFRLPCSTKFWKTPCSCTQLWTVVAIPRGFGND